MKLPKSIKETQDGLARKEFSSVQLVDSYLANINGKNKELNALLTVTDSVAYEQAKKADKLISELGEKAFQEFPLLGVTVAHKDIFLTKGVRTTAASKVLEDYVPAYSSTVVKRLEDAGAIMIGKANCDAWAHGSSGENSDFGPTKNPYDTRLVPGGSSSGSGVSVASEFSLIATATDTCGSIRLPANYCGVVGLKPTYGSVSRYGVIAMASSLDTVGHITNTVEDSKRVLEVTKGVDGHDGTLKNFDLKSDKKKFKIGIPKEFFTGDLDSEVEASIMKAKEKFEKMGATFHNISLPSTKYGISTYYIIQPAEVSSNLGRYDGIRYGKDRSFFGDEAKRRIMLGTYVLSAGYHDAYYLKAMKVRTLICNEVNKAFEEVDAILAPVAPTPPFKIGEKVNDPMKMYLTDIYAATANLSGIPSIAIPSGKTKKGLPLGFQLMGPRFGEGDLFTLGEMYEKRSQ
ncbi:MAG TPA: Asp-tRNA(Asn)/Glu-tRNA(Gln) amidotransferase subunit GatA [Candidatus Saccharimonadales bacterium]|nr:Asp-tRNA(Asn)/Glu-tRNA(Gln) amidotransferase subunit GatA [Candidatus Saccharimonadales bacterium]